MTSEKPLHEPGEVQTSLDVVMTEVARALLRVAENEAGLLKGITALVEDVAALRRRVEQLELKGRT